MSMLSEKEQEKLNELRLKFNIVPESKDYNYMSSRRVEVSRVWAKRLLRASFVLNIASMLLVVLTVFVTMTKPAPEFYASTPSGKLFYIEKLKVK